MGLDTTHDAWSGPYGAFNRWRTSLIAAAGYQVVDAKTPAGFPTNDYPDLPGWDDNLTLDEVRGIWKREMDEPLLYLLWHSDCEYSIRPKQARLLADRLDELIPTLDDEGLSPEAGRQYDWTQRGLTERFVRGLRDAVSHRQHLQFF